MALIKCRECGKEISDSSKKCIHCGCPVVLEIKCSECNKLYDSTTNICPHCGKKNTNSITAGVNDAKKEVKKLYKENKKKFTKLAIIGACALVALIALIIVLPPLLTPYTSYLAKGNYEKAYARAKDDETKKKVALENVIAKISYEISDGFKDPSSFVLKNVYYNHDNELVFEVTGANSYGGNVTNYYDYRYDSDDDAFTLFVYLSSLEDDTYSYYDTTNEVYYKAIKNVVRKTVRELMGKSDSKVDYDIIDRVNALFKQGKLRDVELIPEASIIYPSKNVNKA